MRNRMHIPIRPSSRHFFTTNSTENANARPQQTEAAIVQPILPRAIQASQKYTSSAPCIDGTKGDQIVLHERYSLSPCPFTSTSTSTFKARHTRTITTGITSTATLSEKTFTMISRRGLDESNHEDHAFGNTTLRTATAEFAHHQNASLPYPTAEITNVYMAPAQHIGGGYWISPFMSWMLIIMWVVIGASFVSWFVLTMCVQKRRQRRERREFAIGEEFSMAERV